MPRVLLAPDKFKGSLTAAEVGTALERGIRRRAPGVDIVTLPVADGGDGTVAAAIAAGYYAVPVDAAGPTGELVRTTYARNGARAVVELADVSGLVRLPGGRTAPLTASSRGTGEVLAAALDSGCTDIVLGIGGSACTDGGAGLLRALGAVLRDSDGAEPVEGGAALVSLVSVDLAPVRSRVRDALIRVACDVDNPLTGPAGAAAVYGRQKGADPGQVELLDRALGRWADLVATAMGADLRDRPGAGAAGGVGFGLLATGAELRSGIDMLLDLTGFAGRLDGADLVVTGEGALDEQTLHGKAPAGVAAAAHAAGVPVVAVCGRTTLASDALAAAGIGAVYSLTTLEPDLKRCITDAAGLLEVLGEQIAVEHLVQAKSPT